MSSATYALYQCYLASSTRSDPISSVSRLLTPSFAVEQRARHVQPDHPENFKSESQATLKDTGSLTAPRKLLRFSKEVICVSLEPC